MAKKQYFLIIDTETTMDGHVADFGAIVCDRKGNIVKTCAVLTAEYYMNETLFHDVNNSNAIWTKQGLSRRNKNYKNMLESGQRIIASVNAINRWLEKVKGKYNPELTAYNLAFDRNVCNASNIDLSIFKNSFCLWHVAANKYGNTKKYLDFVLANHYFNAPTTFGNMSYKTNAEIMARFVTGVMLEDEPHTALEDAMYYELPILVKIINTRNWRNIKTGFNWEDYQVKNHFTGKQA